MLKKLFKCQSPEPLSSPPYSPRTQNNIIHHGLHNCRSYVIYFHLPISTLMIIDLRAKADEESISKLKAKLVEASNVYSNDKETISWFVMQSVFDKQDFTIVERYEKESSQEYHLNNPYWKTFDPYVIPLLEKDMDMHRLEELEGSTM